MTLKYARGWFAAALLLLPSAADAHIIAARLGDFYMGALHPFTDLQDVILWIAMGVLAGSLGASKGRWLILVFPLGLLAGLAVGRMFGAVTSGLADASMLLVIGVLLATAARIPTALLCAITFGLAALRGAANGSDLAPDTDRVLFAAGLACAGYIVVTLTMALTVMFRPTAADPTSWRAIAVRALGGWIAAIGLMMAGVTLAS
ncbi:HupE/UreJ family protein [Bradyrhizobium sp. Arg68]|uniref:HupE/UreJ family protein n=1 Tax=Bradyrhizobium ivorense TaxID=2511166 RepID=UPI001E5FB25D|nr:HupE/UreJ family protein [Bradyrhizobium ivorense]MCC8935090.1 HupE/UreJ family protein [Bradyrhizobium ivorense]